jgi:hypothetical protein
METKESDRIAMAQQEAVKQWKEVIQVANEGGKKIIRKEKNNMDRR